MMHEYEREELEKQIAVGVAIRDMLGSEGWRYVSNSLDAFINSKALQAMNEDEVGLRAKIKAYQEFKKFIESKPDELELLKKDLEDLPSGKPAS